MIVQNNTISTVISGSQFTCMTYMYINVKHVHVQSINEQLYIFSVEHTVYSVYNYNARSPDNALKFDHSK